METTNKNVKTNVIKQVWINDKYHEEAIQIGKSYYETISFIKDTMNVISYRLIRESDFLFDGENYHRMTFKSSSGFERQYYVKEEKAND